MIFQIQTEAAEGTYESTLVEAENQEQAEMLFSAAYPEQQIHSTVVESLQFLMDIPEGEILTAEKIGPGYNHDGRFYPASKWDLIAL